MRAISSLLLYIDIYCRKINLKIVKYFIAKSYTILYNEYNIKILKEVKIMSNRYDKLLQKVISEFYHDLIKHPERYRCKCSGTLVVK